MTTFAERAEIAAYIASGRVTVIPAVNAQDHLVEKHLAELKRGGQVRNRERNRAYWLSRKPTAPNRGERT